MDLHSHSFPDSQRKGLEKRFQMQKYISKPDRKKLAERLGLKDSQVNFIFLLSFNNTTNVMQKLFIYSKRILCAFIKTTTSIRYFLRRMMTPPQKDKKIPFI